MLLRKGVKLVLLGLTVLPLAACTPKIDTAFKPELNEPHSYRIESTQDMTMEIMGASMVQKVEPRLDLTFTPTEVDPTGAVTVKMTYDDVVLKQSSSVGGTPIDVAQMLGADPSKKMAETVKGQSLTAQISPKGDASNLEGANELSRKVQDAVKAMMQEAMKGQNVPPQAMDSMSGQDGMAQFFSKDQIQSLFMQVFDYYPPTPLKVEESWTESETMPGPGAPLVDETFTVVSAEGDRVTIMFERNIKPNPDAPSVPMGPVKGRIELTGKTTGKAVVDQKTGWIESVEEQGDFTGQIKVEGGMMMPGNMTMPMKQTVTMKITTR